MNWHAMRSLHTLYKEGQIRNTPTLSDSAVFKYLANQSKELLITKKEILIKDKASFNNTFTKQYLHKYNDCLELLTDIGENTPYCRLDVDDILILKDMRQQVMAGELNIIRQQIIDSKETRRGVSLMFFKHEKHLESSLVLERAVKKILNVEAFADSRDFQYLYVLQCHQPRLIVLCENLHFLKMPGISRENDIELWYAGGRNIEKLQYVDTRGLPVYYICDWDHDGLDIYRLVKERLPQITLLTPDGPKKDIIQTEHKSLWRSVDNPTLLSGLPLEIFNREQRILIEQLIANNEWIVEESNDLREVLNKD